MMIQLKKDIAMIVGMCSPGKGHLTSEDRSLRLLKCSSDGVV